MSESIYNLIPQQHDSLLNTEQRKEAMYHSIYSEQVKSELAKTKSPAKTMGTTYEIDPKVYLKKNEGVPRPQAEVEKRQFQSTKPPVPRHSERPVMGLKSDKNFVHDNLVHNVTIAPRQHVPHVLDVTNGSGGRYPLEESGLVAKYSKLPEYGKVPEYLTERKHQDELERTRRQEAIQAMNKPSMRPLSDSERQALLAGLKENWERLLREYQGLSLVTDTVVKKLHKGKMEEQLAKLEAEIKRIESHGIIYVDNH